MKRGWLFHVKTDRHVQLMECPVDRRYEITTEKGPGSCVLERDHQGRTFLIVRGGYAWDGCSPKKDVFGLLLGTPEGAPRRGVHPSTYRASLVHDLMYQHAAQMEEIGLTRRQADREFRGLMRRDLAPAWMAWLYYTAVRLTGWVAWRRYRRNPTAVLEKADAK